MEIAINSYSSDELFFLIIPISNCTRLSGSRLTGTDLVEQFRPVTRVTAGVWEDIRAILLHCFGKRTLDVSTDVRDAFILTGFFF